VERTDDNDEILILASVAAEAERRQSCQKKLDNHYSWQQLWKDVVLKMI